MLKKAAAKLSTADDDLEVAATNADERPPSNVEIARWAAVEDLPLATKAENMRGAKQGRRVRTGDLAGGAVVVLSKL